MRPGLLCPTCRPFLLPSPDSAVSHAFFLFWRVMASFDKLSLTSSEFRGVHLPEYYYSFAVHASPQPHLNPETRVHVRCTHCCIPVPRTSIPVSSCIGTYILVSFSSSTLGHLPSHTHPIKHAYLPCSRVPIARLSIPDLLIKKSILISHNFRERGWLSDAR